MTDRPNLPYEHVSLKEGLRRGRGHIVFLLGLGLAMGLIWLLDGIAPAEASGAPGAAPTPEAAEAAAPLQIEDTRPDSIPAPRALTDAEMGYARTAWAYFEDQTDAQTGLVRSVSDYPSTTMWDTGSYLAAMISAERLGILDRADFDARLAAVLASLEALPLVATGPDSTGRGLPNKAYHTATLEMVDYRNAPVARGIGWSALDVARLAVPLHTLIWHYPEHTPAIRAVLDRWDLDTLTDRGLMWGGAVDSVGVRLLQEGRLGYEEYGASALGLLGMDTAEAERVDDHLTWVTISGVEVAQDSRTAATHGAHAHVVSEPYILDGLEMGGSPVSREMAWRVYSAQEARHASGGPLTAVTEDQLDGFPYFVYSSVVTDGEPWAVLSSTGKSVPEARILSTKAAFGWHALYRTDYTEKLVAAVADLATPTGWLAGRYEASGEPNAVRACNTNAVVLEAMAYLAHGPLASPASGR
ncbi:MAG: DUF3131 domain-containing protein [Bacteroidota bacterium]